MINLLEKKIDDKRFIKLIKLMLTAGYMENWTYHNTHSGTPQGGIVSPLLSNIYLHEMDILADNLKSKFDVGKKRAINPEYQKHAQMIRKSWRKLKSMQETDADENDMLVIKQLIKGTRTSMHKTNSKDPFDPKYRRLHYCRYADDFIFGIIGSKAEAIQIYEEVKSFTSEKLNLEISKDKSGVSHFEKGVKYLGYMVRSNVANKLMKVRTNGRVATKRTIRGVVSLQVPSEVGLKFALNHSYINPSNLKAIDKPYLLNRSDEEIILAYNSEFRGLAQFYALAKDVKEKLGWLEYVKTSSLLATLGHKHKMSASKMHKRLSDKGELVFWTKVKGKSKQIVVYKLKHLKVPSRFSDSDKMPNVAIFTAGRTEIIQRMNAEKCEYCGKTEGYFEVHHKNKLENTHPGTERLMAQMRRKTIVLCVQCHSMLHAGTLPDMRFLTE
jgi:RNA-directed DNA polymerase